jgi:thiosulfate/3-mercaptopyruvate sulfurtransferase
VSTGRKVGLLGVVLALAVAAGAGTAQSPRDRLITDIDWLAAHLDDPNLVLLHVGDEEGYAAAHIPGARHITLSEISAPENHEAGEGLSLQLPEPAALERTLEGLGVGDDSRVVVYWGEDWVTPSARVVFTLDWIGLGDRTSILAGGMPAWTAAGHPVTDAPPGPPRAVDLTPRPRPDLVVDADWVEAHLDADGYRIIDARAPVHYDGIQPTYLHRQPVRKGHIPGAANIPMSSFVDDSLQLRPAAELRQLFADAGVEPGDTIVGYCHLGQFATLLLFSARTLGYPVKLYDGSFQDWGSQENRPVELPGSGSDSG